MNNNANTPMYPTGMSQSGTGLTKREYFAAMALQGIMGNQQLQNKIIVNQSKESIRKTLSRFSIQLADELLKQLETETT